MKKKAFSIVELLFVIITISIITSIALPEYQNYQNSEKMIAAKSDTMNIINILYSQISQGNDSYEDLDFLDTSWDSDNDGFLDDGSGTPLLINNKKIPWSKKNYLEAYGIDCYDNEDYNSGFYVSVLVKSICSNDDCDKSPTIEYNSCTYGKLKTVDNWNGN